MIKSMIRSTVLTTLLLTAPLAFAADLTPASEMQFKNADILTVIEKVGRITGINFVVDPNVRGQISIFPTRALSRQEVYEVFLSALALNGFATGKSGEFTMIQPTRSIQGGSVPVYVDQQPPQTHQMATMIYTLKKANVDAVLKNLRALPSRDGLMTSTGNDRQIVFTDFAVNLNRIWEILKEVDKHPSSVREPRHTSAPEKQRATDKGP